MYIFLPVAEISINLFLLIGVGGLVGFLSGMFGVGGGFLLTPILIMIGIPPTVAAASDSCQIVAASSSGAAAHFRLGNVDVKLGSILLLGGLVGAAIGVQIIKVLRQMGNADFVITLTYIVVLSFVGGYMFFESLQGLRSGAMGKKLASSSRHQPGKTQTFFERLPLQMNFPRSGVTHSIFMPFFFCALVGALAAIMGVGGGFIMVPMMVYLLRMPMHVAVGTDLFQILFTCVGVTFMQAMSNHTVDLVLALLLAVGSAIGAQIGVRVGKRLRGDQLKILLACIVLLVMVKMTVGIIVTPSSLLSYAKGH